MNKKIIIFLIVGLFLATLVVAQVVREINIDLDTEVKDFIEADLGSLTLGRAECIGDSCTSFLYLKDGDTLIQFDDIGFTKGVTDRDSQLAQQKVLKDWMQRYYDSRHSPEVITTPGIDGGDIRIT